MDAQKLSKQNANGLCHRCRRILKSPDNKMGTVAKRETYIMGLNYCHPMGSNK